MYSNKLKSLLADALDKYFLILENTGYYDYGQVDNLIAFAAIDEFLNTDWNIYVDEKDYKIINNGLNCLIKKTCLLPYPQFDSEIPWINAAMYWNAPVMRITQHSNFRHTEDDHLRITE